MTELKSIMKLSKQQRFIYHVFNFNNKEPFTFLDLEKSFGYTLPQQDLRKIINILLAEKYIFFHSKIYNVKRYKINRGKIKELLSSCELVAFHRNIIPDIFPTSWT